MWEEEKRRGVYMIRGKGGSDFAESNAPKAAQILLRQTRLHMKPFGGNDPQVRTITRLSHSGAMPPRCGRSPFALLRTTMDIVTDMHRSRVDASHPFGRDEPVSSLYVMMICQSSCHFAHDPIDMATQWTYLLGRDGRNPISRC